MSEDGDCSIGALDDLAIPIIAWYALRDVREDRICAEGVRGRHDQYILC